MKSGPIPIRRLVFLLGFMGCGKTTTGQLLAQRLGWTFFDLDGEIERRQGRTINQIFAESGEPYFRQVEHQLLEESLQTADPRPSVIALGGGTFAQPDNLEIIHSSSGISVWLDCPLDELRRRCRDATHRPLFRDAAHFEHLYRQRLPYYERADFRVDSGRRDPKAVVEEIVRCIIF